MISRYCGLKAFINNPPIEVLEEGIDVLSLTGRAIIEQKGMFPYVEREDNGKRDEVSLVLLPGETGEELFRGIISVEDCPARAAHFCDCFQHFNQVLNLVVILGHRVKEHAA